MNEEVTAASLSLRERVSAEQTGEGLALNAIDSSPSSVASGATFSLREKDYCLAIPQPHGRSSDE
jgi:hypothetical protein